MQNSNIVPSSDISHLTPGKYSLIGTIIKEPQIGKFKSKLILGAEKVLSSGKEKKVTGKVWVSTTSSRDSIKTLHYGDRVRLKNANFSKPSLPANPGEFNFRNWFARQKIYTAVNYITKKDSAGRERKIKVKVTDLEKIGEGKTNPLLEYSYLLKEKIEKIIGKIIAGEPEATIIKAMTLGKRELPDFIKEPFLKTGIFHVLVVSGLHVGFVILFVALFIPFLPLRWKEIFTILAIIFYCLITGARPPVLRASLMAIIYLLGLLLNRQSYPYIAIALAVFILLLFNPNQLFAPGFQLSFIITLGILAFSPPLIKKLPEKLPLFLKGMIAVPIAAQITAFPLIAFYFHYFPLLSPLSNIFLVPLAGLNVGLSFLAILFGSIFINLGIIFGATAYLFTAILFKLTKLFAQFPFAYREIGYFSFLHLFGYYYILILIFNLHRLKREKVKIVCFSLILLLNLFLWPKALAKMSPKDFVVTILKVPDGNCCFIQFPDNKNGLIIGDEDNYRSVEKIIKPFLWSQSINTIDYLFLNKAGDNHLGSLSQLSSNFKIKEIIDHPDSVSSITHKNFLEKIGALRKKELLTYRIDGENQILIRSPNQYRMESLIPGVYWIRSKKVSLLIGMTLSKSSYQKLFSLKKNYAVETLILSALPRKKRILEELITRTGANRIILTKSKRARYLIKGIELISVQKRGAIDAVIARPKAMAIPIRKYWILPFLRDEDQVSRYN